MNDCCEGLVHVFGRSELRHVFESSTNLVTHGACNIVARNLVLVIDERLCPYFGVDLVLSIQVIADIILLLGNLVEFLLSMDIHSSDGLSQVRTTLIFLERSPCKGPHI